MSSDSTALGDRMKGYEEAARFVLPRRTYTILRVDGKAFHSYLRGAEKPFDALFMAQMDAVAAKMCAEISGTVFSYAHSDEISLLLTDFGSVHTEPWFGGTVQKMASVSASIATSALGAIRSGFPLFDSRVFTIPSQVEVANYFIWRQRDCVRNSVAMAAQAHFSHRRLHGLNGAQMQELLWQEKGVNWNDYPDGAKRGRVCTRLTAPEMVTYTDKRTREEHTIEAIRSRWVSDGAPHFTAEPDSWLASAIPAMPMLRGAGELVSLDQRFRVRDLRERTTSLSSLRLERCPALPSWILWAFLACLLVLPILAVFAEDRPPPNEITHESDDRDGEAEARAVA